jgi:1,4-alpha-glucan branching enzyme
VHLGSWKQQGKLPGYRWLAQELANYCREMGFTHVEILPITEHLLDESWGYEVTGYFAPTSRYGWINDFQWFVDHLHQWGIGVILDWVPSHFPIDDEYLKAFDGSFLFEGVYGQKRSVWQTGQFDYRSPYVRHFLIASALFWAEVMHVDGLRVDSVCSILYTVAPQSSEWSCDLLCSAGIHFLQSLTTYLHTEVSEFMLIAEESTSFEGITTSVASGGLGFDWAWNMGWIHDTLAYLQLESQDRKKKSRLVTFPLTYAFEEKFLLPLSHDEMTSRQSLWAQLGQDKEMGQWRLFYSFLICFPGAKLIFMGGEWGNSKPWSVKDYLPWRDCLLPKHRGMLQMAKLLHKLYVETPPFWEQESSWDGFLWLECEHVKEPLFVYVRLGNRQSLICLHHFGDTAIGSYDLRWEGPLKEVFCSADLEYGGDKVVGLALKKGAGFWNVRNIPPCSTTVWRSDPQV